MDYLLDTHILIWFLEGDTKLSEVLRNIGKNFISISSIWEIAIKTSISKLETDFTIQETISLIIENGFELLQINQKHCLEIVSLEFHHRDPFDRMLIAQTLVENLTRITKDQHFKQYPVKVL
ncbi:MAG: type II toxin-antitoxin system VapC family toxin [Opitutaceae bacterium]|nr:type II toxin-antitoxin system VapC family toxin [Cytophagales bacterium]